jgi:hypothetical protein
MVRLHTVAAASHKRLVLLERQTDVTHRRIDVRSERTGIFWPGPHALLWLRALNSGILRDRGLLGHRQPLHIALMYNVLRVLILTTQLVRA